MWFIQLGLVKWGGREREIGRWAHENILLVAYKREWLKNWKTLFSFYPKVLSWWPSLLSGQKSVLRTWWNWHLENSQIKYYTHWLMKQKQLRSQFRMIVDRGHSVVSSSCKHPYGRDGSLSWVQEFLVLGTVLV